MGAALRRAGFDCNARIVVALPDGAVAALATVGIVCSAVAVLLDPKLTVAEVEARFTFLRPDAVLVLHGRELAARTAAIKQGLTIIEAITSNSGHLGIQFVVPQINALSAGLEAIPGAPAFILQTSGTTADPKSIPLSHQNILETTERIRLSYALTPQDRCLCVIPVYHAHGLVHTVLTPLVTGGSVAFPVNAMKLDFSEWFVALQPTWYSGGPTLHLAVLEKASAEPGARTIHSLRFIEAGGAPLTRNVHESLQTKLDVPLLQIYGCSEGGLVSANAVPPGASKLGTCGIPPAGTVIVVDKDGRRLPRR